MSQTLFDNNQIRNDRRITVYQSSFVEEKKVYWDELFKGFDFLHAITYSSSISFMSNVFDKLEKSEVIFGYPKVMSPDHFHLATFQLEVIKQLTENKDIHHVSSLIKEGKVKFYVSFDKKSHEKLYLLKSKDNRYRVIAGSANLSLSAFNGVQRECIFCFDGKEAYDVFYKRWEMFRDSCTSTITPKIIEEVIKKGKVDVEDTPTYVEVKSNPGIPVLLEESETVQEEKGFILSLEKDLFGDAAKTKNIEMTKAEKQQDGSVIKKITFDKVKEVIKVSHQHQENERQKEKILPSMCINYNDDSITFGKTKYDLHPSSAEISNDIKCVLDWFKGYDNIIGDKYVTIKNYWKFLNWYFASPFIPYLRNQAIKNNLDPNFIFPVYGMLYGISNAGKSKFVWFLNYLLTGMAPAQQDKSTFTHKQITLFKNNIKGLPIFIDDVTAVQFKRNWENIMKNDLWGAYEEIDNYPSIVITSNEEALSQDCSKRCLGLRLEKKMSNRNQLKMNNYIKNIYDNTSNALFREYARRMFSIVHEIYNEIPNIKPDINDQTEDNNYLLARSSEVLYDIFSEYAAEVPEYITKLQFKDYFSPEQLSYWAINDFQKIIDTVPEYFDINEDTDRLIYKPTAINTNIRNDLNKLAKELPPEWDVVQPSGSTTLSVSLTEAKKIIKSPLLGTKNTGWISRLKNFFK